MIPRHKDCVLVEPGAKLFGEVSIVRRARGDRGGVVRGHRSDDSGTRQRLQETEVSLEAGNLAKTDFLSNVSHELSTPRWD